MLSEVTKEIVKRDLVNVLGIGGSVAQKATADQIKVMCTMTPR